MKLLIDSIKVDEGHRIREEMGDLTTLQDSIQKVGLINPIVVDEKNKLVAGLRRLTACKKLGWKEIEVRIAPLGEDPLFELETEVAENLYRKDFTPAEIIRIEVRRQEILRMLRGNVFRKFWRWLVGRWRKVFGKKKTAG